MPISRSRRPYPNRNINIFFIRRSLFPKDQTVTSGGIVIEIRPIKPETHITRIAVGGNLMDYPGKFSTPTADLTTLKVFLNCTISTPGAHFMTEDIRKFYLNTLLKCYEFMRLSLNLIPEEIKPLVQIMGLAEDGYVY